MLNPKESPRVLSRRPVVFALVCAVVLASLSFFNSNMLQRHYGFLGLQRQIYEPSRSVLKAGASGKALKALVRDAVDRGLVVIVNASDVDVAHVLADHSQGARLDISSALDGPTGDILVEVMQELRNMEDMATEVADLKHKLKKGHACETMNTTLAPRQGDHGLRPSGRALYPFMTFSSFRYAPDEFSAVGIAAPSLLPKSFFEDQENSCTWVEWDPTTDAPSPLPTAAGVQRGRKSVTLIRDDGESFYSVVVIRCQFADPAGSNGYGGHLFVNATRNDHHVLLAEPPEAIDNIQFEGPLDRRYALCTPPIWKPIPAHILQEWLLYHHHLLGSPHFFLYIGIPLDDATVQILQPLLDQERLTIVDLSSEMGLVGGEDEYPTTLLALNDCVQRARFVADWALLWDFNEYLHLLPPANLQTVITSRDSYPYIAIGNHVWSSTYCTPKETISTWATDRMRFRLALPSCLKNSTNWECLGGSGGRRMIINPRKVFTVHNHDVIDPSGGGADVSMQEVRLNTWIGNILSATEPVCTIVKNPEEMGPSAPVDGYWYMDDSFAEVARDAHNASLSSAGSGHNSSAHNTKELR